MLLIITNTNEINGQETKYTIAIISKSKFDPSVTRGHLCQIHNILRVMFHSIN